MAEQELDALVVRAPDNVLYLTNFWGMKGYDACVFPREGEPVLICLEASARRRGRDRLDGRRARRPRLRRDRPAAAGTARTLALARRERRPATGGSGSSSRSARRPPTGWSASRRPSRSAWFERSARLPPSATPLLAAARAAQDRAGDRADAGSRTRSAPRAMEHVRGELRPG